MEEFGPLPLRMRWKSEFLRLALESEAGHRRLGHAAWEWQEHQLAKEAARMLRGKKYSSYLGVEHGALEALQECKRQGLPSCLIFTSPHHSFWEKWAKIGDPGFHLGSSLGPDGERLMRRCYDRVDEEMRMADTILTNSSLVGRSLVEAGADSRKIMNVPLGADVTGMTPFNPWSPREKLRLIVSGQVSERKGSLLLIQAWKELHPPEAELHFYGGGQLSKEKLAGLPASVVFHGNVDPETLRQAYRRSQVLVLPTLCDGFGMVVPEAMVQGCAVLATANAGAADWIEEGKNGWVVAAGNVGALREGLEKVLASRHQLDEMRAKAQETARQNTWGDFRKKLNSSLEVKGFLN
jgi:glycosyltransferase involved in cell wall biosynthesis